MKVKIGSKSIDNQELKNRNLKNALCGLLAAILLFSCTFAYFSDNASTQVTGTAGTVALSMDSNINLLNPDGKDIINPGDMRDGSFTVTNGCNYLCCA